MPSKRIPVYRPHGSYSPELTLHEFDWANLVEARFFEQMLVGIIGVIIGLVSVANPAVSLPSLVIVDPWLSAVCVVLAFARVWKTIREEHETAPLWESVSAANSQNQLILDRVFEIPYLFTLTVLPIAAIAPQLFMVVLFVFYVADNFYNAALARGAEPVIERQSYGRALLEAMRHIFWLRIGDIEDARRRRSALYFLKRSRYNSAFMALLFGSFAAVLVALGVGDRAVAWWVALVGLLAVLLCEVFIEPIRNRGMTFMPEPVDALTEVTIEDVTSRALISDGAANELTAIHEEAFGPEERQFTMADILSGAGLREPRLRVVTLGGRVVGYAFLEIVKTHATAFLWYMAVKRGHRSGGIGARLLRETLDQLRDEGGVKYVFFEVHRPSHSANGSNHGQDVDRRRIGFYRRLRAHWVRGVDYRIPAANNARASVAYDPMFFVLDGKYQRKEVAERIAYMAADNFDTAPNDERWLSLQASLKSFDIVKPDDRVEGY